MSPSVAMFHTNIKILTTVILNSAVGYQHLTMELLEFWIVFPRIDLVWSIQKESWKVKLL